MATQRLKNMSFKPGGKPDLLSVIERRGRTGESYLADNGITTIDQFQSLVESHLAEYDISEKFVALGEAYTLALQLTPARLTPEAEVPEASFPEDEENAQEKPKKRKKNTDKSPE